jgi:iron(III) transport system ATP-binding protein
VLRGVDITVPEGSFTAILGPSGSGKTTLLRVLAGFERGDQGVVTIGEQVVDGPGFHVPAEQRHVGYVSQEGSLFPHLNVEANVGFGLPRQERRGARVTDLLDALGLAGLGGRYPHQLSGGQQQRVALARALAISPRVVLLDEPFASLDAALRSSVRSDVRRVLRDSGATAILVTHDQDEALSSADQVAVVRDGAIVQVGSPKELYDHPQDPDVSRFIGAGNLVAGQRDGSRVHTPFGVLALREHPSRAVQRSGSTGPVVVLIRPEQLTVELLGAQKELDQKNPPGVSARVVESAFHGHDTVLYVHADALGSRFLVRGDSRLALPPGTEVVLRVRGSVLAWPAGFEASSLHQHSSVER